MTEPARIPKPIPFHGSPRPTLGVEIELQIIDPETRNLTSRSIQILERIPDEMPIKQELTQSTIEVVTGICNSVAEARADLTRSLEILYEIGDELGHTYAAAGTHPFAQWREQSIYPNERYLNLVKRIQWPARRLMIYGLHVHVGVKSGEKAIAICNALTKYLPHLLALSASSPFIDFEDTGLASARTKIFEGMPTAGLPFRLANYGEFQSFMNSLINAGAIESIREIWWDIRPHPQFGTIEVRICDCPSTLTDTAAITALTQCLVDWLDSCYDTGLMPELLRPWIVRENKWRAARYGLEANVIIDNAGTQRGLADDIEGLVGRLEGHSIELECEDELKDILKLLRDGASYQKQRRIFAESSSFPDMVDFLAGSLRSDAFNDS
ncbi:MAG TPA: glutamate--cysteine ligase [Rhodothermales bacterium]